MIQSMTGFGSAFLETETLSISVEIKTLNSKFSDIYCKMPKTYSAKEIEIRNLMQKELERGKMEISLNVVPKDEEHAGTAINRALVKAYFKDLLQTAQELDFSPDKTDLLRIATLMPNAFQTNIMSSEEMEREWQQILSVIKAAVDKCIGFRKQEGENTAHKFREYIGTIEDRLEKITEHDPKRIPLIKEKIQKALNELENQEAIDKNRFEQELIYYIERLDISEEKVRLTNHLGYFRKELESLTNGKKLNFISQEIGREINTIGSKANDVVIQKFVVEMKDELEKIKEQTLNIL
jgi:uncharacterized protein (TIGR00255 family)